MTTTTPVIECRHLSHAYGKRVIYEDLNFTVAPGRILGLLGKNGTGKTTTINILTGFLKPTGGRCLLYGEPGYALTPETKSRIGLLLEGHVGYPFFNVEENEAYYRSMYPRWRSDIYRDLVARLRIAPRQKIGTMSNGQRSQVALSVLLAQDPDLLILDDFSLGLDPGYRRLFTDILRNYVATSDKTVFMTSHIIQDLERLVDDCIILDYGRILVQRSVEELMRSTLVYTIAIEDDNLPQIDGFYHPEWVENHKAVRFYSELSPIEVSDLWQKHYGDKPHMKHDPAPSLEDLFIGLTGKY